MKKQKLIAALPAVLFAALLIAVFAIMGSLPYDRPSTSATNTFGNLSNGGMVAEDGSMLYYIDGKGMLRCKSGEKIYYIDESAGCLSPYRSGIVYLTADGSVKYSAYNGDSKQTLAENASSMMVSGNWVYYADKGGEMHKYFLKTG